MGSPFTAGSMAASYANFRRPVHRGTPLADARSWCAETLASPWMDPEEEVVFRGHYACLRLA